MKITRNKNFENWIGIERHLVFYGVRVIVYRKQYEKEHNDNGLQFNLRILSGPGKWFLLLVSMVGAINVFSMHRWGDT